MYDIISYIGKGSTGNVYKVEHKISKKKFALKQSTSPKYSDIIFNEIKIYSMINNQNDYILRYYDNYTSKDVNDNNIINLVLENCEHGSCIDIIFHNNDISSQGKLPTQRNFPFNEKEISCIIYMVLKGLNYLHEKNLIHRDIKARNILINSKGQAKLCDFGICREYKKGQMNKAPRVGSPYWMAPEVIRREEFDFSSDIWSIGITVLELLDGYPPYCELTPKEVMKEIAGVPKIKKYTKILDDFKCSKELRDFVLKCLNADKDKRPTAKELLNHKFLELDKKKGRTDIIVDFLIKNGFFAEKRKQIECSNKYKSSCLCIEEDEETIYNESFYCENIMIQTNKKTYNQKHLPITNNKDTFTTNKKLTKTQNDTTITNQKSFLFESSNKSKEEESPKFKSIITKSKNPSKRTGYITPIPKRQNNDMSPSIFSSRSKNIQDFSQIQMNDKDNRETLKESLTEFIKGNSNGYEIIQNVRNYGKKKEEVKKKIEILKHEKNLQITKINEEYENKIAKYKMALTLMNKYSVNKLKEIKVTKTYKKNQNIVQLKKGINDESSYSSCSTKKSTMN